MTLMRGKFLRLLVVVAISLAVPIQGVLGATASLCMTQSHDAGSHHHDNGQSHHHGHCAPCVACCTGVAIASSVRPVFQPLPASAPDILAMPAPAGIQPDALDRPPLGG
jgi:hypothetical protein